MENIVAARRLRKSVLKDMEMPTFSSLSDIGISSKTYLDHHVSTKENIIDDDETKKKISFKTKLMIKIFVSVVIVFVCLISKLLFADSIKSNKYIGMLISEYKKDYTKEGMAEKVEELSKSFYNATKYIVPENVENYISTNYVKHVKPKILNFDLKSSFNSLIGKKENIVNSTEGITSIDDKKNEGMGGGEPLEEPVVAVDSSSVSLMQEDIAQIKAKNIDIKKPLSGTITSDYGARDQIFEGVNSYHTGTDIANKTGTEIHSATEGTVVKIQEMDKYYGNNVEIEVNGVTFKYAHMDKINVKQGDRISQGDIVGLVGSTGMVTGPHLHFEIKINGRTVDPQQIIAL